MLFAQELVIKGKHVSVLTGLLDSGDAAMFSPGIACVRKLSEGRHLGSRFGLNPWTEVRGNSASADD